MSTTKLLQFGAGFQPVGSFAEPVLYLLRFTEGHQLDVLLQEAARE